MLGIAGFGFANGNPKKLTYAYDPDANPCGVDKVQGEKNYKDYPYIYFAVPQSAYSDRSVCVKTCPKYSGDGSSLD